MAAIESKTKKYESLVRRSERAVEWIGREKDRILFQNERGNDDDGGGDNNNGELTEEEEQTLRHRLVTELGYDPSTQDRDNIDYDPLRYWVLYIKHIRESYPADSQKQFLLMERCARTFMNRPFLVPHYKHDVRFIRTCILYADKTSNPSEVFKLMSKIKVGTNVALFWVAWAWVAEKSTDYPFTEKIFQKGLSVGAEPKKFLEDRQKQFLRRMSRHWLNSNQSRDGALEEADEEGCCGDGGEGGRGALNSLSSRGVAANNRSGAFQGRPPQPSTQASRSRQGSSSVGQQKQTAAGFNIFQDNDENNDNVFDEEDNDHGYQLTKECERTKENNMRAEMWNERGYGLVEPSGGSADSIVGTVRSARGGAVSGSSVAAAPAFSVFVDEDCDDGKDESVHNAERVTDNRSLRQRLDGGTVSAACLSLAAIVSLLCIATASCLIYFDCLFSPVYLSIG